MVYDSDRGTAIVDELFEDLGRNSVNDPLDKVASTMDNIVSVWKLLLKYKFEMDENYVANGKKLVSKVSRIRTKQLPSSDYDSSGGSAREQALARLKQDKYRMELCIKLIDLLNGKLSDEIHEVDSSVLIDLEKELVAKLCEMFKHDHSKNYSHL